jgi:hypothetical protein
MRKLSLTCVLMSLIATAALRVSGAQPTRTVLVIYSNDRSLPANRQIDDAIRETLDAETNLDLKYQTEFLDYPRYGDIADTAYDKLVSGFLRGKYAGQSLDVIVAAGPAALRFLLRHQDDLFLDVPIVAIAVTQASLEGPPMPARFLSIPITLEYRHTLDLAVCLQPKATEIVVVTGASDFDVAREKSIRKALAGWHGHPPIHYWSGLRFGDALNELSRLPHNTIVYTPGLEQDGSGRSYSSRDAVQRMAETSAAPLYGPYGTLINYGIVGGYVFEMAEVGRQVGQVLQRILGGEKLTQRDMPDPTPSRYVVDWKQMNRWNLREANLPPGTIIVNREPSAWQKYKRYILGSLLLLALQSLLIFYLLLEQRRRRLAQQQLGERLRFETLIAKVSSEFANLDRGRIDLAILHSLQRIQEFFRLSIASIWQPHYSGSQFFCTHRWPEDAASRVDSVPSDALPDTVRRLSHGESVVFSNENEMSGLEDCASFRSARIKSFFAIPIQSENRLLGALSLVNVDEAISWPADTLTRLSTIVDILGGALARQHAAEALRESEVIRGVILEYMHSNVVVIDKDGLVVETNENWSDAASKDNASAEPSVAVGFDYFEICRKAIGSENAMEPLVGIQSVLSGSRQNFETEYASPASSDPKWFRILPCDCPEKRGER